MHRIKRLFSFFFIALLFMEMNAFAFAESKESFWEVTLPHDLVAAPSYLLPGQTKLWCVNPNGDFAIQIDGKTNWAESTQQKLEDCGILLGAASEPHELYLGIASNGRILLKKSLSTHETLSSLQAPENVEIDGISIVEDSAIVLGSGRLWRVPTLSFDCIEEIACEGLHQGPVQAIASYQQDLAVMFSDGVLTILHYDAGKFQVAAERAFDEPLDTLFLNRDYGRYGLVYGARKGSEDVWNYHLSDGRVTKSESFGWPAEVEQVWYVNGGIYFQDENASIWRYMFDDTYLLRSPDVYDHAIHVLNDSISGLSAPAIDLFHDVYPQTALQFSGMGNMLGNATSIQADEYDLLCISSGNYSLDNLVRSGAILPLDGEASIIEAKDDIIDLWNLCSSQGKLYMIPIGIRMYVWTINPSLFEQVGIPIPDSSWTLTDFFAMGEELAQVNAEKGTHYTLLYDSMDTGLPYILKSYLINHMVDGTGKIDLDADEFTHLIDCYLSLRNAGLIVEHQAGEQDNSAQSLFRIECPINYNDLQDCVLVLPPMENGDTRYLMDIDGMVLGSRAPHPEEAAQFMACYLSPENVAGLQSLQLGPILVDQDAWRTSDRRFMLTPPQEVETIWRNMAQYGIVNNLGTDAEYTLKYELYPHLVNGEIDTHTFVEKLTQILRMMLRE